MTIINAQSGIRKSLAFWVAAILAMSTIVAWIYWPGLTGGFIFDDLPNLVENPNLKVTGKSWREWVTATFSSPSGPLQRPLSMFTFALNYYFTGMDPVPMKLTNLLIHIINSVLVLGLTRKLIRVAYPSVSVPRANWVALFVATLWAVHPINFLAVLYVVQRMESLSQAFVFAGLWLYAVGRARQLDGRRGIWHVIGSLVGFTAMGALAKESAVLLPLLAFFLELCLFRFRRRAARASRTIYTLFAVFLAIPAVLGLAKVLPGILAPGALASRNFTVIERLLTESRVVLDYLRWSLFPNLNELSLFHDDYVISRGLLDPPSTIVALIVVPALLFGAWKIRSRLPLLSLGVFWFFAAQALTATVIPLELVFEHRNYFASLGVCLALAELTLLLPLAPRYRTAGIAFASIFLLLLAGLTHLRAIEWSAPLRFAISEAAKHPQSPRATYHLAGQLVRVTNYDAKSPFTAEAWAALEAARKAPGSNLLPVHASLIFAARTGAPIPGEWWDEFQDKLRNQPQTVENRMALIALNNCAVDGYCDFPKQKMVGVFSAALSRGPEAGVLSLFGKYALYVLQDVPLATRLWRESVVNGPSNPQFRINLAALSIALGNFEDAEHEIAKLRTLGMLGQYSVEADRLQADLDAARARVLTGRPVP